MIKISERTERLLEFIVIGLVMGVAEDLLAVWFSTGEPITWNVLAIVFVIALPFAFISEYVVDHPKFWRAAFGIKRKESTARSDEPGAK